VQKCESASGIAGVLEVAAALPAFAATVRDMDADPYLLNVDNGTLDLRTLELRPHSPADKLTKVCRGAYRPECTSEAWGTFLPRILPDQGVRGFLQRYVGVGLLGEVREHVLVIGQGTGANGKSVFDTAVRFALGDYAITAEPDLFMHREGAHPTGEMDLLGVRWATVSESDKDRRLGEAKVKRLTGGDTMRARRMRQDFVEFAPSHTVLLITNFLPTVSGDDAAVWRRLRVVPFTVTIPEHQRDPNLSAQLQLEADAVLSWAVAGWVDYQRQGLAEPDSVRVATNEFHTSSDALGRFIAERCVITTPNRKTTTSELYEAWQLWAAEDGAEPMGQKTFGQALDRRGYPVTQRDGRGRWRAGIDLKNEFDNLDGREW
jgi:putative DNA primase/helicase